jgi:hypothetical protein
MQTGMDLILLGSLVERKIQSNLLHQTVAVLVLTAVYSSQAARRDQNRIAQREFRLRKQQRVSIYDLVYYRYV